MIFVRLFRNYFLEYDTKKMYILQRNFNIIKNLNNVRYKGNYDRFLLRKYLLCNKVNICVMCQNNYPFNILESAHLMPRKNLSDSERLDINLVEFMCPNCHKLYDRGLHSINLDGKIIVSSQLDNYYELNKINNYDFRNINLKNREYIDYHNKNIFVR